MFTILITTGATITFKLLIDIITDVDFIENLIKLQVSKLYIQYGNEINNGKNKSKQYFDNLIESKQLVKILQLNQIENYHYLNSKIEIIAFPFSSNINSYIKESDLIISHGGTGSILDCLKLQKKLIVVINDQLMDNHQYEIANEFEILQYCKKYEIIQLKTKEFFEDMDKLLNDKIKYKQFHESDGVILKSIILEELGK
ncbi:unnamed protein product [Candida verbasci]|uniref:UDP-N-acetylglucosamine transferase subunit ALG13 n=1 Tax=Candida verbasci TaxID=1227364 RepID=A0A9W4XHA0_9ASCO|nr:unnamed protein product [Candida verbasci]